MSIDPSAIIGPGVLIQADPHSHVRIGAGVCLGMGTVIHARGGTLDIQSGATLSMGVLVVGAGTIAAGACVGAGTTAINPAIGYSEVVPAHTLMGDRSRFSTPGSSPAVPPVSAPVPMPEEQSPDPWASEPSSAPQQAPEVRTESSTPQSTSAEVSLKLSRPVYGQDHVNQLMRHLFPSRPLSELPPDANP
ncbi:carbon dioxide concentrating mechanism protein [Synechococcales cyanobacterium C]|uniref:Carbon dioxide concentrating mechanism protein n=1 Tax=Petrachloros mirabilis ULC683 TaxID=2781853 RepID=A0A8K1ZX67_9CYAN|nr:carbon dioxide concentrating mechanism protein [Petrachloros mirabilis]NCJ05758.1 carbon dioxide concentrating mechanism protein [Petrachloros mirabilis ULC683]